MIFRRSGRAALLLAALTLTLAAGCAPFGRSKRPAAEGGGAAAASPAGSGGSAGGRGTGSSSELPPPGGPGPLVPSAGPATAVRAEPAPSPVAEISPPRVLQGDFTVLKLDRPAPGTVRVSVDGLDEQPRVFVGEGGRAVSFIGFPAAARPGQYPVRVTWDGGAWTGSIEVLKKKFTEDRLVVTREQEETYYDPRQEAEWQRVFALRSRSDSRPLWRGAFRPPLDGSPEITTYFGEIRYVNGTETGRHSGMDFGVPEGTPFHAPAWGRVILAEKLIVSGNTVIIDHGLNLFTAYYHASALLVKPGDLVAPGQVLGKVGSTGFSTGPHLHWTATIGNTPVDPWPLTVEPPLGILPAHLRYPPELKE